jgi:trimeric autotransporter adhesin
MNKMSVYAGVILCCVVAGSLSAAEPARHYISYTKRNTLSSPATATLRFSLWDAPTNGSEVWSEEKLVTMTVPGIRVALGDVTPLDTVDFSRQLWVQVELKRRIGQYVIMGARDLLPASAYAAWAPNPDIITDTTNTAIGIGALHSNTTGTYNTAIGYNALTANTTGQQNTASGWEALYANTSGSYNSASGLLALASNTEGSYNTASGQQALGFNTTGTYNTASGYQALYNNTSGSCNSASGFLALGFNTTGTCNTASGYVALYRNTTGSYNTASGRQALGSNTEGSWNTASGYQALYFNTTAYGNTASGYQALYFNTTGTYNTASGYQALYRNTSGTYNTAIGYGADVSAGNLTNATAIGYYARVDASNKVVIGNSSVTSIGGYADWVNFSDRRLKENIVYTNGLGLDFIEKLRTVSYNYRADESKRRRDGLIAQDVKQVLADLGLEFSGLVIDEDRDSTMNLSYGDFVLPLINAVQELDKQNRELGMENKELSTQNREQAQQISALGERLSKLEAVLNE